MTIIVNAFELIGSIWEQFMAYADANDIVMAILLIDLVSVAIGVFFLVFGLFKRNNPS